MASIYNAAKRHRPFEFDNYGIMAEVIPTNILIPSMESKVLKLIIGEKIPDELAQRSTVSGTAKFVIGEAKEEEESKIDSACICKQYDLIWGAKVNCDFRRKVVQIASNLELPQEKFEGANWLMAVMALETKETFRPNIQNTLGYTGLLQFGKVAAQELETTIEKLSSMTDIEQLDYVEKYFMRKKRKLTTLTDVYLAVIYPKSCGHGREGNYVVLTGNAYKQNPVFYKEKGEDGSNPNGKTYVWEIEKQIKEIYNKGQKYKETHFECNVNCLINHLQVQIIFLNNRDRDKISSASLNIIRKIAKASNNPKVYITSTIRSAREQAEIMYNQTSKYGVNRQYKLYGSSGDRIIDVYVEENNKGSDRNITIGKMEQKIIDIGAFNISHHAGNHNKINVFDVSAKRLNNPSAFWKEAKKLEGTDIYKLINESDRFCYHFEIKQQSL
jgi:hypothetical protein